MFGTLAEAILDKMDMEINIKYKRKRATTARSEALVGEEQLGRWRRNLSVKEVGSKGPKKDNDVKTHTH